MRAINIIINIFITLQKRDFQSFHRVMIRFSNVKPQGSSVIALYSFFSSLSLIYRNSTITQRMNEMAQTKQKLLLSCNSQRQVGGSRPYLGRPCRNLVPTHGVVHCLLGWSFLAWMKLLHQHLAHALVFRTGEGESRDQSYSFQRTDPEVAWFISIHTPLIRIQSHGTSICKEGLERLCDLLEENTGFL